MKKIRQIREDHNLILEKSSQDYLAKYDPRHKEKGDGKALISKIPNIILLKRKSIRTFPDNQFVALYYSQALDKYITIPFGENTTGVNMHEEFVFEAKEKGLDAGSVAAINQIFKNKRSESNVKNALDMAKEHINKGGDTSVLSDELRNHPEIKAHISKTLAKQPHTTEKSPTIEPIEKPPSDVPQQKLKKKKKELKEPFLGNPPGGFEGLGYIAGRLAGKAVVGGLKLAGKGVSAGAGALKSKMGIKEQQEQAVSMFEAKLVSKKQKIKEEEDDNKSSLKSLIPGYDAYQSYKKGDYLGAAGNLALDAATIGAGAVTGGLGAAAIRGGVAAAKAAKYAKAGTKLSTAAKAAKTGASRSAGWKLAKGIGKLGLGAAALAAGGDSDSKSGSGIDKSQWSKEHQAIQSPTQAIQKSSGFGKQVTQGGSQISAEKQTAKQIWGNTNENIIDQLRELATKTDLTKDMLMVNEEQVDINNNIAEKVVKVYDSLNKANKTKFAKMLGENKESFKKAVNFALRY